MPNHVSASLHATIDVPVMRCEACEALDPGPRDLCPKCQRRLVPATVLGHGTLVSWTMIRRPPAAFKADGQYAVAVIKLDAGVQVTGRLADPEESIGPGTRVAAIGSLGATTVFRRI